jgi:hypothetical protein
MRKTALTDVVLCKAVQEMAAGLIDADLGGGVLKKRVGLAGRGKRGGVRTLVATNKGNRWFFVFGFGSAIDISHPVGCISNCRRRGGIWAMRWNSRAISPRR